MNLAYSVLCAAGDVMPSSHTLQVITVRAWCFHPDKLSFLSMSTPKKAPAKKAPAKKAVAKKAAPKKVAAKKAPAKKAAKKK